MPASLQVPEGGRPQRGSSHPGRRCLRRPAVRPGHQYHQNWITYRSTAEALKHEKYLYLARADVYSTTKHPLRLLAERIEGLISQEHARWISSRRHQDDEDKKKSGDDDDAEEPAA